MRYAIVWYFVDVHELNSPHEFAKMYGVFRAELVATIQDSKAP